MRPIIQANGFDLTQALRTHTELRVATALGWASAHIRQLNVALSDINGPRGGVDKRCRIQVVLGAGREVVIEDVQADLYVAINRAADRAGRAMVRQIQRSRDCARQRPTPVEVAGAPQPPDAHGAGSTR